MPEVDDWQPYQPVIPQAQAPVDDWEPYQPVLAQQPAQPPPPVQVKAPADDWAPYTPAASGQTPPETVEQTERTPGTVKPAPQSQFGTAVRKFVHGLPGALGGVAGGALVGGAAGGAGANPLTVLGGAVIGGIAGGFIGEGAKEAGLKLLGIADSEAAQLAVNAEEHPWTTAGADAATAVVGGQREP